MPHSGIGPIPSRIMLVGEAWGYEEDRLGEPFVGASGQELNRMLHEAGIMRSECYVTNLINYRPPDNDLTAWIAMKKKDRTAAHVQLKDRFVLPVVVAGYNALMAEIAAVQPNVIIAFGNWAMWALTGKFGIRNWRGSQLRHNDPISSPGCLGPKVIPTFHPAAILRQWDWRAATVADLRRAARHLNSREYSFPEYKFIIRPSFDQAMAALTALEKRLATEVMWLELDLETQAGHIACCGISWSLTEAICIPLMTRANGEGYWSLDEECVIVYALYRVLTHKNARVRLQNGLYDAQYTYRHWHFIPRIAQDTMISQHALFSDQPKSLAFQASLYCENYVFWKEEGKQLQKGGSEEEHWSYNLKDDVNTREVGEAELRMIDAFERTTWPSVRKVHEFQQAMLWPVLRAMNRGVRIIEANRNALAAEVQEQIAHREQVLFDILGYQVNPRSSPQMIDLFYNQLGQPPIMSRPKKGVPAHVTCDDEALQKIATREPLLKPIINCISDIRTLEIFLGNFILAKLDVDRRMRCSYNIGGSESGKSAPKTYRLSSSKNAFDCGTNLQNIPSEKSKSVGKAAARGHIAMLGDPYSLPNVRSLFGPDPGFTFFDQDLDRADLQVMAWDADEPLLKEALRKKVDLHLLNVYVLDGKEPPPLEELVETHPKYPDHRGPRKLKREFAKVFCHATDYLGKSRTVAAATGRTVHETERAQAIYLGTYKGIKRWQDRIIDEVRKRRYVENKFGYRWYIFDRIDDSVMPEAVAWIPQSTVSIVINRIWMNLFQGVPEAQWDLSLDNMMRLLHKPSFGIEVLLQVHDSLAGQFPTHMKELCLKKMQELSTVIIPYDDPLIIPTGVGTSEVSWGEC